MDRFIAAYDAAVPQTMVLCREVTANCFVNATYDPAARNGTCTEQIDEFYTGFIWENGNSNGICPVGNCGRNDSVVFPFPRYTQTDEWRSTVQVAVNTVLNFIV